MCNLNWPESPGQMDLKPENKSLLLIFGESLFLTSVTKYTVGNFSAWDERGRKHCWKR